MNNPNPFVPKGSLLEQDKRRSRMKLTVGIVLAVSICSLTAMLIQGCKRENTNADSTDNLNAETNLTSITNPIDTNVTANVGLTNLTGFPPVETNTTVIPQPEPATTEYTVVAGDTLGKIAKNHGVSLSALKAANPNVNERKLIPNKTKIVIPASTGGTGSTTSADTTGTASSGFEIYTIKKGDTLTKISKQYGVSVKAIQEANNMTTTKISAGKKLKIPVKTQVVAPVPAVTPEPIVTTPTMPTTAPTTTH